MDTAWSIYEAQVNALNASAPTWHCEACPNTATARTRMHITNHYVIVLLLMTSSFLFSELQVLDTRLHVRCCA